jgi:hypothetical protein
MKQTLTRPDERALFGLDDKQDPAQTTEQTIQPTAMIDGQD